MANIKRQQLRAGSRLPTTLPTFHDLSRANALGVDSLARISQQSARYPGGHLKGMNFFRALGHPVVFPRAIASVRPKRARRAAEKCGLTNEKRLRAIVKRKEIVGENSAAIGQAETCETSRASADFELDTNKKAPPSLAGLELSGNDGAFDVYYAYRRLRLA